MTQLTVRRAERALRDARSAHVSLEAAVVDGDETIDAAAIAESAGAVRLAELRMQSAEQAAESEAQTKVDAAQAARERRRRKAKAIEDEERRANWQRAIDSGAAARNIAAFDGVGRPKYPAEYDAMLVEFALLAPHPTDDGPTAA